METELEFVTAEKNKFDKIITVVGGANLDIKGYTKNYTPHSSSPGWIEESPGGVGRNISENLALLNKDVILLSVISDDHFGRKIIEETASAGVDISRIKTLSSDKYKSGIYLAHLDQNGDLIGAINDMRILKEIDFNYIQENIELIKSSSLLIIDTNLDADIVDLLLELSLKNKISTLVEAVSVEKSLKIKGKLHKIDYLRANVDEAEMLMGLEVEEDFSLSKRIKSLAAAYIKESHLPVMIISAGSEGVYLFEREKNEVKIRHFNAENIPAEDIIETTGAGDSLTAVFAAALLSEKSRAEAVMLGIKAASLTIQSKLTCNPEIRKLSI